MRKGLGSEISLMLFASGPGLARGVLGFASSNGLRIARHRVETKGGNPVDHKFFAGFTGVFPALVGRVVRFGLLARGMPAPSGQAKRRAITFVAAGPVLGKIQSG